jgi:hypothetical protein
MGFTDVGLPLMLTIFAVNLLLWYGGYFTTGTSPSDTYTFLSQTSFNDLNTNDPSANTNVAGTSSGSTQDSFAVTPIGLGFLQPQPILGGIFGFFGLAYNILFNSTLGFTVVLGKLGFPIAIIIIISALTLVVFGLTLLEMSQEFIKALGGLK